jgi:hypothetical protein
MTWVLLGAAWLAFNVGFVAGCRWVTRRRDAERDRAAAHDRIVTTLRVAKVAGDSVYIPASPVGFIDVTMEN